eukprot:scaffold3992_cov137-Isochrysis_galbana.AAC.3
MSSSQRSALPPVVFALFEFETEKEKARPRRHIRILDATGCISQATCGCSPRDTSITCPEVAPSGTVTIIVSFAATGAENVSPAESPSGTVRYMRSPVADIATSSPSGGSPCSRCVGVTRAM